MTRKKIIGHQFVYATVKFSESGFQPDLQKSILVANWKTTPFYLSLDRKHNISPAAMHIFSMSGCWGVAAFEREIHNRKIEIISLVE